MAQQQPLYLDDLVIGAEYRSAERRLDAGQTVAFAREFDPQPAHLDPEAAKGTLFQGLSASGWHTAAITMKLLVESVPFGNGIIGAGIELQWPRPTRPDDTLHVVSKIVEITPSRSKPDRGIVTVESLTLNQQGETCQRLVAKLVVMRRAG